MSTRDGRSLHPLYDTYLKMLDRCYKSGATGYVYYGARGIAVCDEWRADFWSFARDMGERPAGTTLDRIDNDGNYELSNCRWATRAIQNANRRKITDVEHFFPQCADGHALSPDNVSEHIPGRRLCRTCRDITVEAALERRRFRDRICA